VKNVDGELRMLVGWMMDGFNRKRTNACTDNAHHITHLFSSTVDEFTRLDRLNKSWR